MKKILMLLALLIYGAAFGCEGESISGIKLGCQPEDMKDFKLISLPDKILDKVYLVKKVKFFDEAQIETYENGVIGTIALEKNYVITINNISVKKKEILKDFKEFMDALEKRWGEFDKSGAETLLKTSLGESNSYFMQDVSAVIVNKNPKSEIVKGVILGLTSEYRDDFISGKPITISMNLIYADEGAVKKLQETSSQKTEGF